MTERRVPGTGEPGSSGVNRRALPLLERAVGRLSCPNPSANPVGGQGRKGRATTVATTARGVMRPRVMTAVSLGFATCLALPAATSYARTKPDVKTLQKKLDALNVQVDTLTEKYDKSQEDLKQ